MYSVSLCHIKLFRLRLLLLHSRGAISFNDLKLVNGVQYETLFEACLALGLIEYDEEWSRSMQEAVNWMMPCSLRHLFVRILIHCQPINPEQLWEKFKGGLSEDFMHLYHDLSRAHDLYCHLRNADFGRPINLKFSINT